MGILKNIIVKIILIIGGIATIWITSTVIYYYDSMSISHANIETGTITKGNNNNTGNNLLVKRGKMLAIYIVPDDKIEHDIPNKITIQILDEKGIYYQQDILKNSMKWVDWQENEVALLLQLKEIIKIKGKKK